MEITPDVVMVSSLIKACDAGRNWQDAVHLLELMHVWQLHPGCLTVGPCGVIRLRFEQVIVISVFLNLM